MGIEAILGELTTYVEFLSVDDERTIHINKGKLDIVGIAQEAEAHQGELQSRFTDLPNDVTEAAFKFSIDAYLSYLDSAFVATQAEGGTVYSPDKLIDSVRMLTLSFNRSEDVKNFYEALVAGLTNSKRFMYRIVVDDLTKVLSDIKGDKSNMTKFGAFAIDVAKKAAYLTETGSRDKGKAFEKEYRDIVQSHFPSLNENDNIKGATEALDYDILEIYAKMGVVSGVRAFQRDYGNILSVQYTDHNKGHDRHLSFTFQPDGSPPYKSNAHLEGVKVSAQVKNFVVGVIGVAIQNLKTKGVSGQELTDNLACLSYVKKHL